MAKPRPPKTTSNVELAPPRNNTVIIIFVAVIVALAGVAAIFVATSGGDDDPATEDATPYRPVTVTGTPLPQQAEGGSDPAVGTQAPSLVGSTFTGEPVKVEADGRPKVVGFYAHWCPHCQKELPLVVDWMKANQSKYPGVDFVAIATGTNPTRPNYPPAEWFNDENYPLPVMADDNQSKAAGAFGLQSYPYFVFLDGENKVVIRKSGELPMTEFETYVKQIATTATAPPSSTTTSSSTSTSTTLLPTG